MNFDNTNPIETLPLVSVETAVEEVKTREGVEIGLWYRGMILANVEAYFATRISYDRYRFNSENSLDWVDVPCDAQLRVSAVGDYFLELPNSLYGDLK